jgi:hypothetical protein
VLAPGSRGRGGGRYPLPVRRGPNGEGALLTLDGRVHSQKLAGSRKGNEPAAPRSCASSSGPSVAWGGAWANKLLPGGLTPRR